MLRMLTGTYQVDALVGDWLSEVSDFHRFPYLED